MSSTSPPRSKPETNQWEIRKYDPEQSPKKALHPDRSASGITVEELIIQVVTRHLGQVQMSPRKRG